MDITSIIIYTVFYVVLLIVSFKFGRWFERNV